MKVVVIGGPTGVGKSELAFALASALNGELISCDSVQVYRHVQIGANKTPSDAAPREHLLDLVDLDSGFTAADYYEAAVQCIEEVHSRGRLPIVVGGTGFYLEWLLQGRPSAPETDAVALARVDASLSGLAWDAALAHLRAVDPVYAQTLLPNDWYRLRRALAVFEATGQGLSAFAVRRPSRLGHCVDFRCLFLTADREAVCRNIDWRCEEMIERGLIEEVAWLQSEHGLRKDTQVGRSIGYLQVLELFERCRAILSDASSATTVANEQLQCAFFRFLDDFKSATRQYSRKQENWFAARPAFKFLIRPHPFAPLRSDSRVLQTALRAITSERGEFETLMATEDVAGRALRSARDVQRRMKIYRPAETRFKGPLLDAIIQRLKKCLC